MQNPTTETFGNDLLNALPTNIAVLDAQGNIIWVNEAWKQFARENNSSDPSFYVGSNYLAVCENTLRSQHDETTEQALNGLRAVLFEGQAKFLLEYPCPSPTEERWFMVRATRFQHKGERFVVTSHEDITAQKKTEKRLEQSYKQYHDLINNLPDTIYTLDLNERRVNYFNRDTFLGYSRSELMSSGSIQDQIHPEDIPATRVYWSKIVQGVDPESIEFRVRNKNGEWDWVDTRKIVITRNLDGTAKEILVLLRLITDRKQAEEQIAYHAQLLENVNDIIIATDEDFDIRYWNQAAVQTFGWEPKEVMGRKVADVLQTTFDLDGREDSIRSLRETGQWKGEVIQYTKDNKPLHIDANVMAVRDRSGRVTGYVSANRDITERKLMEKKLVRAKEDIQIKNDELQQALQREERLARIDSLTGVYTRRHFFHLAEQEFAIARRYGQSLSILLTDIDHFKQVNDRFGHQTGDDVLRRTAQIAVQNLREADIVARYGGEEFIFMLPNTSGPEAGVVAERIRESISALSMDSEWGKVSITISSGIAELSSSIATLDQLIAKADQALYQAKKAGRNRTVLYS